MHTSKKPRMVGAGVQDKTPVVAVKSRKTKKIKAKVTKPQVLLFKRWFEEWLRKVVLLYTQTRMRDIRELAKKNYNHESVNHGVGKLHKGARLTLTA